MKKDHLPHWWCWLTIASTIVDWRRSVRVYCDHLLLWWCIYIGHVFLSHLEKPGDSCVLWCAFCVSVCEEGVGARCICHLFNRIPTFRSLCSRPTPWWIDRPAFASQARAHSQSTSGRTREGLKWKINMIRKQLSWKIMPIIYFVAKWMFVIRRSCAMIWFGNFDNIYCIQTKGKASTNQWQILEKSDYVFCCCHHFWSWSRLA